MKASMKNKMAAIVVVEVCMSDTSVVHGGLVLTLVPGQRLCLYSLDETALGRVVLIGIMVFMLS